MKKTALTLFLFTFIFSVPLFSYTNEYDPIPWPLEGYRPNYFMLGIPNSKLSLSMKIEIIKDRNFYFAYTQLMWWSLWEESNPFYELNYNPEFFYRFKFSEGGNHWLDVGLLDHESNGRELGPDSRSWNRFYLRYTGSTDTVDRSHKVFWSVKTWYPYLCGPTNTDILWYRGLCELEVTFTNTLDNFFYRNDFTIRIFPGGPSHMDFLRGGQEITFRANSIFTKPFLFIWIIQFYHGYCENLLDYNREETELRIGLSF
ncbi:MAG: phospholipase A [Spirochaetia bacterium]|nr:phospholipase A [Spirochaetia bacterium]